MRVFRNNILRLMTAMTVVVLTACSSGDDLSDIFDQNEFPSQPSNSGGSTTTGSTATGLELDDLSIAIDSTALAETVTAPAESADDYEDYVGSFSEKATITITYSGTTATVSGSAADVEVSVDGADVTVTSAAKGINYVLQGSASEGSFKVASSEKKFKLTLNGVTLKNSDGPAINIQSGKRCYVVANDGTVNTFTDGTSYALSTEDQKGTIFSEGELLFHGAGRIRVYANTKAGIASDDYIVTWPTTNIYVKATAGNGMKANDAITINGGVINVETSATAAKGLSSDGLFTVRGGRTTAITTGGGTYEDNEAKGSAGVKADSTFTMTGGELRCKSTGTGGKGISCDQTMTVSDGTIKVITTGGTYKYGSDDTKAKGIKADGDLKIDGGMLLVKATGDDGSEGIESKGTMTINSGTVEVESYDDALNSAKTMTLNGGFVYAAASGNDGIDSNGDLIINGGTIVAYGTSQPEQGLDANEEGGYKLYINGGTVVAVGGGTSYPASSSKQPSIVYGGSLSAGSVLLLSSGSTRLLSMKMLRSYNGSATFLISSPDLSQGTSYTLTTGATVSGTDFAGLITSPTVSSEGSSAATVSSLSSPYSQVGSSTGGMGGGGGHGGWGGGPGGH